MQQNGDTLNLYQNERRRKKKDENGTLELYSIGNNTTATIPRDILDGKWDENRFKKKMKQRKQNKQDFVEDVRSCWRTTIP